MPVAQPMASIDPSGENAVTAKPVLIVITCPSAVSVCPSKRQIFARESPPPDATSMPLGETATVYTGTSLVTSEQSGVAECTNSWQLAGASDGGPLGLLPPAPVVPPALLPPRFEPPVPIPPAPVPPLPPVPGEPPVPEPPPVPAPPQAPVWTRVSEVVFPSPAEPMITVCGSIGP